MMLADIPYERGLSYADMRWGDSSQCNFPLFSWLSPLPLQWMYVVYWAMIAGRAYAVYHPDASDADYCDR